ncbi:MAG TPA: ATP-binding cassette domain-containing protein [Verrucomicrobiae bacterium]|jgi:ABC-type multidrug transport system ATPase subunit/DNA-binding beta-propeller fold protein YncE|nr:ATP-binding cassette domain-containing protein [Verrucomicrobiae bacterium]
MNNHLWNLAGVGLGRRLLDLTLPIEPGVTAVLGHSGAGKTSLLNLLVGFEKPDAGKLTAGFNQGAHRIPIFWVPADGGLWPHLTVAEHIAAVAETNVDQWLKEFDLTDRCDSRPDTLSAGEQARLSVARALAADAAVLVMDEPLVHVDPSRVGKYWQLIRRQLEGKNASLVFATHSPRSVLAEARRVVCLREGRVQYNGEVDELYWRAASPELAGCLGEANWMDPEATRLWLRREEQSARCFRPEQILAQPDEQSPFVVESSRFQGSVAELELRHEPTGAVRTFFHRPAANHLARGTRILLKALLCLLLCLHVVGCRQASGPAIPVQEVHLWSVPSEGVLQPAARSLTIGNQGEVIALDTAGRVLVYAPDGSIARQWRMPDSKIGKPEGVVVLHDGRVIVCDTHYHRVVEFHADGTVALMFGKEGQGPGEFIYPVAVAKDAQENLYVAEYGSNDRVQKFTSEGRFLLAFGSFGTAPGQFQRPSGLVWRDGKIYAADAFNNRIQIFTDDGKFLKILDSTNQPLSLRLPYDLKLGADDALYAVEYGAGRVTRLDLDGRTLGRYGTPGSGLGQFATPWGLAVDAKKRIYVADTGNRRVVELQMP